MKAHLVRVVAAIVLLFSAMPLSALAAPPEPSKPGSPAQPQAIAGSTLEKIEPLLLKELSQKATTTYLVYMHEQANLGLAQAQPDRLSQRRAVVTALRSTAQRSQDSILRFLQSSQAAGKVKQVTSYWVFNGLAVTGDLETLLALAARADVERIQANHVHHLDVAPTQPPDDAQTAAPSSTISPAPSPATIEWNVQKVRAPETWNLLGITGQGMVVASMDTGVYYQHPALQRKYRGYNNGNPDSNYNWFDATGTYPAGPNDGYGHGTHTMGTMVGSDADGTNQVGVAPGAQWIAVKVFNDAGDTTDAELHAGFQWILAPTNLQGQNPDPAKAPDVVSNSWGDATSSDQTFWNDVLAWRAAGIMSTFAGGNEGPDAGTVDSPGSFPQSFALGATNSSDVIANFSSRGPSPWGEIKPEIAAPGVGVRSSVPPSENSSLYEAIDGTSMATPHGAAASALLLQARPDLTITATEYALTSTALPLPTPANSPNNDYGWGRLDTYQAVLSILNGGRFWGRVTDAVSGAPVAGAGLVMTRQDAVGSVHTTTDAQGYYTMTVGAGIYQVTASDFWYISQTASNVEIVAGFTTILDFPLLRRPGGVLRGQVTSAGVPLTATISFDNAPVTLVAAANGFYSLTLPAGLYDMRVRPRAGYRQASATGVSVGVGTETVQNFDLAASPRILLVDADAWSQGASKIGFWQSDLDDLFYTFDLWTVISFTTGLPLQTDLQAYDIVVWDQPTTSPGYVGAWPALAGFLDNGGRLLISGQDIGYWDDHDAARTYYRGYLHAQFLRDDSAMRTVQGVAGDIFGGMSLTLNGAGSANNQTDPDSINPLDGFATTVLTYTTGITPGSPAGLKIAAGAYQAIYLAFGLEGAGPASQRQPALRQALDWLSLPALTKTVDTPRATPGQTLTYTLRLANTSSRASTLSISDRLPAGLTYVAGSATGGLVFSAALRKLDWQGTISSQTALIFTFQAVLGQMPGGSVVLNTATLGNAAGVSLDSSAAVLVVAPDLRASSKLAQPALVASGQQITYTINLSNTGVGSSPVTVADPIPAGTHYVTGSVSGGAIYNPALNRIEWSGVITAADASAGGYSVASSDDAHGPTFAWMDISTLGTRIPAGDDTVHGPFDIGFPFDFYGTTYTKFYVSSNGWLSFVSTSNSAFSNTCLPSTSAPRALLAPFWDDLRPDLGQVYYLSGSDTMVVSYVNTPHFGSGGPYSFQVLLRADGTITFQYLNMQPPLNSATIGVQDATATRWTSVACNEEYVHNNLALLFTPHEQVASGATFGFRVRVDDNLPLFSTVSNRATVASMGMTTTLIANSTANTMDLAGSTKTVSAPVLGARDTITYTLAVSNTGTSAGLAFITDTLPVQLVYAPGSAGNGAVYDNATRSILWSGIVSPGITSLVTFAATAAPGLSDDIQITNMARISDPVGHSVTRSAVTRFRAADLSASHKDAAPAQLGVGDVVTFTITVANGGGGPTTFFATDTLPSGLSYITGTAQSGHGEFTFDPALRRFVWSSDLPGQNQTFLRFSALAQASGVITNTVQISDDSGAMFTRAASVVVAGPPTPTPTPTTTPRPLHRLWLPVVISESGE